MSKNVKVNGNIHNGISEVELLLADGSGTATFKDVDEISAPSGGITPSGTKEITANGEYDVTNYAKVNVQVASSGSGGYSLDDLAGGAPTGEITITAPKVAENAFYKKLGITKAIFESACTVDSSGFNGCTNLKEVEFLVANAQISGYGFGYCTGIEKVIFRGNAKYLASTAFNGCTALTDIYVPWSETDEIQNVTTTAPWGATNATIHYNS